MDFKSIKRKLFGYEIKTIENFLHQMNQTHVSELENLKHEIQVLKKENLELQNDLEVLRADKTEDEQIEKIAQLLNLRLHDAVLAIRNHGEIEITDIETKIQQKKSDHSEKIELLSQQSDYYKTYLNSILHEFSSTVEKLMKHEVSDNTKIESTENITDTNQKSAKIIQLNIQSSNQNAISHNSQIQLRTTGTENFRDTPDRQSESLFWGNIQTYIRDQSIADVSIHHENMQEDQTESFVEEKMEKFSDIQEKVETEKDAVENLESPIISQEIDAVRNRYIVGKLSGSDLYDQNGEIIIRRDQKITTDIVEKADKAGKLSELIVHMSIPGLEKADENI